MPQPVKTIDELIHEKELPAVVADERGLITYINEPFTKALGWKLQDVVGKPLTMIIPKSLRDAHHLGFSRFLATKKPTLLNRPLQLKTLTKDGREVDAGHFIIAECRDGRWTFGATLCLSISPRTDLPKS